MPDKGPIPQSHLGTNYFLYVIADNVFTMIGPLLWLEAGNLINLNDEAFILEALVLDVVQLFEKISNLCIKHSIAKIV